MIYILTREQIEKIKMGLMIDSLSQSHPHKEEVDAMLILQSLKPSEPVAWLVSDAQGRYATIRDLSLYAEEVYEPLYALGDEK